MVSGTPAASTGEVDNKVIDSKVPENKSVDNKTGEYIYLSFRKMLWFWFCEIRNNSMPIYGNLSSYNFFSLLIFNTQNQITLYIVRKFI